MKVLTVNAGSSSLKFACYKMPEEEVLISGYFEKVGLDGSFYTLKINGEKVKKEKSIQNHEEAIKILLSELTENKIVNDIREIEGVGHRVVHGGDKYADSTIIDNSVISEIEKLCPLAPLHNPANLTGINAVRNVLPNVKMVAVFDTAFHQTIEKDKYLYPVPYSYYENYGVRKYGFHGTSHKYISEKTAEILGRDDLKIISCHIGSGASVSAIKNGKCVDTSLGFTPNTGVMMGTRSGDIDSGIIPYMVENANMSLESVMNDLSKNSGLLGVSGVSSDDRDVENGALEGNERCRLAQTMYQQRVADYIAKYYVMLDKADVIVFTAGLGENSKNFRKGTIEKLKALDIYLDEERNNVRGEIAQISSDESKTLVYIIPTDEEVMIARDAYELVK